eukprot:TRINITY_DN1076_c2_g1_i1.p1 TRINITY_DN1076_c2_g1~~TRINITY_DN1076_c2_g1_i1.p1  ORF type:complete len:926 (+),score=133.97 TRINITY_DN1076_c2_g1_i1:207-2984(+)
MAPVSATMDRPATAGGKPKGLRGMQAYGAALAVNTAPSGLGPRTRKGVQRAQTARGPRRTSISRHTGAKMPQSARARPLSATTAAAVGSADKLLPKKAGSERNTRVGKAAAFKWQERDSVDLLIRGTQPFDKVPTPRMPMSAVISSPTKGARFRQIDVSSTLKPTVDAVRAEVPITSVDIAPPITRNIPRTADGRPKTASPSPRSSFATSRSPRSIGNQSLQKKMQRRPATASPRSAKHIKENRPSQLGQGTSTTFHDTFSGARGAHNDTTGTPQTPATGAPDANVDQSDGTPWAAESTPAPASPDGHHDDGVVGSGGNEDGDASPELGSGVLWPAHMQRPGTSQGVRTDNGVGMGQVQATPRGQVQRPQSAASHALRHAEVSPIAYAEQPATPTDTQHSRPSSARYVEVDLRSVPSTPDLENEVPIQSKSTPQRPQTAHSRLQQTSTRADGGADGGGDGGDDIEDTDIQPAPAAPRRSKEQLELMEAMHTDVPPANTATLLGASGSNVEVEVSGPLLGHSGEVFDPNVSMPPPGTSRTPEDASLEDEDAGLIRSVPAMAASTASIDSVISTNAATQRVQAMLRSGSDVDAGTGVDNTYGSSRTEAVPHLDFTDIFADSEFYTGQTSMAALAATLPVNRTQSAGPSRALNRTMTRTNQQQSSHKLRAHAQASLSQAYAKSFAILLADKVPAPRLTKAVDLLLQQRKPYVPTRPNASAYLINQEDPMADPYSPKRRQRRPMSARSPGVHSSRASSARTPSTSRYASTRGGTPGSGGRTSFNSSRVSSARGPRPTFRPSTFSSHAAWPGALSESAPSSTGKASGKRRKRKGNSVQRRGIQDVMDDEGVAGNAALVHIDAYGDDGDDDDDDDDSLGGLGVSLPAAVDSTASYSAVRFALEPPAPGPPEVDIPSPEVEKHRDHYAGIEF